MHIRDHGDAVGVFHRLKDLQALRQSGAAEGVDRGAVGLVVGRLEDEGNVESLADILVMLRTPQGKVQILKDVDSTQQGEPLVVGDGEAAELDLLRHGLEDHQSRASLPALVQATSGDKPRLRGSVE